MKRTLSQTAGVDQQPHGALLGSIYANDTARRRKHLFRSQTVPEPPPLWQPAPQPAMSPLTDWILNKEEAFQNTSRVHSLYADQSQQVALNPVGYQSNISAWVKALSDATRAGVIRSQGATHDLLHIRSSEELRNELAHPEFGTPVCLPQVFKEAQKQKEMIKLNDFLYSKTSIYSKSWLPSPYRVMQWGFQQVGLMAREPDVVYQMELADFVIVKNVELAADQILKQMKDCTSTMDRVLSKADFMKRFAHVLNPAAALTTQDFEIALVHLARDKQAIRYNADTIKFKLDHERVPEPITKEDEALVKLHDALNSVNAKIEPLMEKVTLAEAAAREAVAAKNMVRAKAALRSKKVAEKALEHHTGLAVNLESTMHDLRMAADRVGIVEAMRLGADAIKTLNEKVGGAEGVQGVVDALNEQMEMTDEISGLISENAQPMDDADIDDEFAELEKAEKAKKEKATAAKLASLAPADQKLSEMQMEERRREAFEQMKKDAAELEKASQSFSSMSFMQRESDDDEMEDAGDERVPVPA